MANLEQLGLLKTDYEGWKKWQKERINRITSLDEKDPTNNPNLADLTGADLSGVDLAYADLRRTNFRGANLSGANLMGAVLTEANLSKANLKDADLSGAHLKDADLSGACLNRTDLYGAMLWEADLRGADLREACLQHADLREAHLRGADLRKADLRESNLTKADLSGADLAGADLREANLFESDLSGANLTSANLIYSNLVHAEIDKAKISKSKVYGVNVWGLVGEFKEQNELVITPETESAITVDNIKVAQFVYLILNNKEIRDVINTLTSKTVLILGRFSPERKAILDALRNKLREFDLLPIIFDFDRPVDKDITETINTLASISYFVIADVTSPRSSPLELQALVPEYQIPFVPIIQEGELPFSMMEDLRTKHHWMLTPISYNSVDELINILKIGIIDPAIEKHNELRIIKARKPTIILAKDILSKK